MPSTYEVDELIRKWSQDDLTPEQMIGYMLQHLKLLHLQQVELASRLVAMAAHIALTGAESSPAPSPAQRNTSRR